MPDTPNRVKILKLFYLQFIDQYNINLILSNLKKPEFNVLDCGVYENKHQGTVKLHEVILDRHIYQRIPIGTNIYRAQFLLGLVEGKEVNEQKVNKINRYWTD